MTSAMVVFSTVIMIHIGMIHLAAIVMSSRACRRLHKQMLIAPLR